MISNKILDTNPSSEQLGDWIWDFRCGLRAHEHRRVLRLTPSRRRLSSPDIKHSVQYHGLKMPKCLCLLWPLKAHCSREGHLSEGMGSNSVTESIQLSVKSGKSLRFNTQSNFNSLFPPLCPNLLSPSCLTLCMHCAGGWTWDLLPAGQKGTCKNEGLKPPVSAEFLITPTTPEIHLFEDNCTRPLNPLSDISVLQRSLLPS